VDTGGVVAIGRQPALDTTPQRSAGTVPARPPRDVVARLRDLHQQVGNRAFTEMVGQLSIQRHE
jgi:hypothetical protein